MKHRPWHALKTEDRLQSEDTGLVRKDQYYLNGDEFKLLALIVAVEVGTSTTLKPHHHING